ncbi:MAG: endonuclease family [Candidatus Parcubacteria bacterium]
MIPRETRRVTYSTEIRNLKKLGFNEFQKAVIIGTILGDGCLCENWSKTNYRLLIMHSVDQKEYILWKYSILKQWILSEPRFYSKNNSLTIHTISHPELTGLHGIFYRDNKK